MWAKKQRGLVRRDFDLFEKEIIPPKRGENARTSL
jgi:hypothetical protein